MMKFKHFLGLIGIVTLLASCGGIGGSGKVKTETKLDSVSYFIGFDYGSNLLRDMATIPGDPMNYDALGVGFFDGLYLEDPQVAMDDRSAFLNEFFGELRQTMEDSTAIENEGTGSQSIKSNGMSTIIKGRVDSAAYLLGYEYGFNFTDNMDKMPGDPANIDLVAQGFKSGIMGDSIGLEFDGDARQFIMEYFSAIEKAVQDSVIAVNAVKMDSFLVANKAKEGVIVTESGLQYEVIVEGSGAKPAAADKVSVHYHGTLIDGTVFDSSVERGTPAEFGVGQVIPGWTEALQLMAEGSKWKLTIPADLAYGDRAAGSIPPGSVLIFDVELLDIVQN